MVQYTTDDVTGFLTRIQATASSFDDSVDGISNPVNGTMGFRFTAWDSAGNLTAYTASFDDFRISNGSGVPRKSASQSIYSRYG